MLSSHLGSSLTASSRRPPIEWGINTLACGEVMVEPNLYLNREEHGVEGPENAGKRKLLL